MCRDQSSWIVAAQKVPRAKDVFTLNVKVWNEYKNGDFPAPASVNNKSEGQSHSDDDQTAQFKEEVPGNNNTVLLKREKARPIT